MRARRVRRRWSAEGRPFSPSAQPAVLRPGGIHREKDRKGGPLSRGALRGNPAAVVEGDLPGDGQPQSRPPGRRERSASTHPPAYTWPHPDRAGAAAHRRMLRRPVCRHIARPVPAHDPAGGLRTRHRQTVPAALARHPVYLRRGDGGRRGEAEDMAEVAALGESVTVPAGSFSGCLKTLETTPPEPGAAEYKYYARRRGWRWRRISTDPSRFSSWRSSGSDFGGPPTPWARGGECGRPPRGGGPARPGCSSARRGSHRGLRLHPAAARARLRTNPGRKASQ